MNKPILSLNIETSTTLCSVSLGINDECADCIEINDGYYHAEKMHLFIQELLHQNKIKPQSLSYISVTSGPGSYTGLRIGSAGAKVLAYALNIPLLTVSSLHTQAAHFHFQKHIDEKYTYIISTMYARENKIYYAVYDKNLHTKVIPQSLYINSENIHQLLYNFPDRYIIGSGTKLLNLHHSSYPNITPSAKYMIKISYQKYLEKQFENLIGFEPIYI